MSQSGPLGDNSLDFASWPSMEKVILPSRAFLLSWREQTLPTRRVALDDAVTLFNELSDDASDGLRDMALLGVIADAMQPLEDLAYLATAWTEPFGGLANYVKATVYSGWTPSGFWQRVHKRDSEYFDVLAGISAVNPATGAVVGLLEGMGTPNSFSADQLAALQRARDATRQRLRVLLGALASDWGQFSDYFYAYKHGGLSVHRPDVAWVGDDVGEITPATELRVPSLAVWHRGGKKLEGRAEFGLDAAAIVRTAAGTGRLAVDLCASFVESRLAVFDALELSDDGTVAAIRSTQLPWTIWLREGDLDPEAWTLVGRGPRLSWIDASQHEGEISSD